MYRVTCRASVVCTTSETITASTAYCNQYACCFLTAWTHFWVCMSAVWCSWYIVEWTKHSGDDTTNWIRHLVSCGKWKIQLERTALILFYNIITALAELHSCIAFWSSDFLVSSFYIEVITWSPSVCKVAELKISKPSTSMSVIVMNSSCIYPVPDARYRHSPFLGHGTDQTNLVPIFVSASATQQRSLPFSSEVVIQWYLLLTSLLAVFPKHQKNVMNTQQQ